MFAIVEIAGTQEKLEKGSKLKVPLHADAETGKSLTFDKVLLIGNGDDVTIGAPFVAGATVEAKILRHGRDDKVRVVKAHRRKRYHRVHGHRQNFTEIEIMGIKVS
jgi:large subunit ribosomal protein L21